MVLFVFYSPHRCPEPRGSKFASINITSRLASRAVSFIIYIQTMVSKACK